MATASAAKFCNSAELIPPFIGILYQYGIKYSPLSGTVVILLLFLSLRLNTILTPTSDPLNRLLPALS